MSSPEPRLPAWATAPPPTGTGLWGPPELRPAVDGEEPEVVDPVADAREAGFDDGFQAGVTQARAELQPAREALGRLVSEIERELGSVRHRAESNLAALGLSVARWLLEREVSADPTVLEPLIRRAVALLPAGSPVEIHGNPADVEVLSNTLALSEPDGRAIPVHWVTDPVLDRGSFRLVSPERLVDGRADVALRTLYERLAGD